MAKVKNSSGINISRVFFENSQAQTFNLGNKIFNGYVYNFSYEIGFNGEISTLTLNLALDRTLKKVPLNNSIITKRKQDIQALNGNIDTPAWNRKQSPSFSSYIDEDFQIDERYLGIKTSYNISIVSNEQYVGKKTYELKNFRISSYSISKRDNQKILTLVMQDLSFVLNKIHVGLLGQHIALDERSEINAVIDKLTLNCPQVNQSPAGVKTLVNHIQPLHFAETKLADSIRGLLRDSEVGEVLSSRSLDVIEDTASGSNKANFIIIKGKGDKTIENGYGAVIILGEEDFKDGPCDSSETLYSFNTLLRAMERLGIVISTAPTITKTGVSGPIEKTLKDKSNGAVKKSYSGKLKDVLNQWCEDYAYSYTFDFSSSTPIKIVGIDLASPLSKENVIKTRLELRDLESENQTDFVIRSEDFNYDIGRKNLKLYSSYYFKDSKEKSVSYENFLGNYEFKAIDLASSFPQLFADKNISGYDFCGSRRTYIQVLTSAVLGRFSSRLRQIYNYSIGAYQALGFIPLGGDILKAKLPLAQDPRLIFQEAVTKVLDIEADILYDKIGNPILDFYFGFYNADLANQVDKIENYIADFIGKHYWTDVITAQEGSLSNNSLLASYELATNPPTQKVYVDQLYVLPVFQEMRYLLQEINSLFSNNVNYYTAFGEFLKLKETTDATCKNAGEAYQKALNDINRAKQFRFYTTRNGASYGAFQELIKDIQQLDYRIGNVGEKFTIDLGEIYAPIFKELSPVSIAMLQAVLPVDLSTVPLGNYKFGILCGFKDNIFTFNPFGGVPNFTNPIEFQNTLREKCALIMGMFQQQNLIDQQRNKQSCSKTILYTACVQQTEIDLVNNNNSAALQAFADPYRCQAVRIYRRFPPDTIVQANINKTLVTTSNFITLNKTELSNLYIQSLRNNPVIYQTAKQISASRWETVVLPSQRSYFIRLVSKTSSEVYFPFLNIVKGGLEDPIDLKKIIENEGFSFDLFVNNITPNIRELYGDQTTPSYQFAQGTIGSPFLMNYQGYADVNNKGVFDPKYELLTVDQYHKQLKSYYDSRNISLNEPSVSYNVDLFCSSISEDMKELFSVNKGLSKMNFTLGENGLSIQLEYQSYPGKEINLETLLYKTRPNIKLVNTNFFR